MTTLSQLIYGGGYYADGAQTITAGKPHIDGKIDIKDPYFPKRIREQINWLNVNETDIPAIISSRTAKTMGVKITVQVESPIDSFNQQAERWIETFCGYEWKNGSERAVGELTGQHHFDKAARIMSDFYGLHGGFIIRHHYNALDWTSPYKYELVGVDMIDISKTVRNYNWDKPISTTLNGIERDIYGEITAVWLYATPEKAKSIRVPYNDLTYIHEVWMNIDQQAAVSRLTSILSRLDATTQYGIAELDSAIEEAKAGHFIESAAYAELMKVVADEVSKVKASSIKDRVSQVKDLVTPILQAMSNLGIKAKGLTPIPLGDVVHFNTSKRQGIYKEMNANSEMKFASSQGMSDIGVYSKAADANYSSIKYTLETDQRQADIWFNDISTPAFFSIFSRAIIAGVQIGKIGNRVAFLKNPSDFLKFRYIRQNKIDTEPSKNALANQINLELGVTTPGRIVEQATGTKYETFLDEKQAERLLNLKYEVEYEKRRQQAFTDAGIVDPIKPQGNINA